MPAGPAPITATRSGRSGDGAGSTPSSLLTSGILTRRRSCAPGSEAGDVAVPAVADELGQGDLAAVGERRAAAGHRRAGRAARPGHPVGQLVEVAVPVDRSGDLLPVVRDGVE